ncbi:9575_t:CDS:2 [Funneliformis geosporum]|uniref:1457_t:CDS:1 n=1 Tax=Funneliformis geosporum TaxID=1117311 RepID=A0A9W4SE19_9GLOM|nr:9575_t:CDS:2 [Funneliformis geosporum]CAI2166008.1 1457_t:CDS:2 [Funneliformis geosporum]
MYTNKFRLLSNIFIPRINQSKVHNRILPSLIFQRNFNIANVNNLEYFDTSSFVERLEKEGFTRQQSEAIMTSLSEVMNESMQNLTSNMVTLTDQEKTVYTAKVDISKLKSEMQMVEKSDFNVLKAENERLSTEIEKLKQKLNEEVKKTQGGVRLDLNLERGRIKDESRALEASLKETHTKIESDIAGLRTNMETVKFQILQYMIGTLTGAGALILGK